MIHKVTKFIVIMNTILQCRRIRSFGASAFLTSSPYTRKVPSLHRKNDSSTSRSVYNGVDFDVAKFEDLEPPESFPDWAYEPRDFFGYELIYRSKRSNARVGRIHTPHGVIDTPGYVAVATNGAIKGVDMRDADDAGQQLVFCNSYHLMLQPGPEIIEGKKSLFARSNFNVIL